MLCIKQKKSTIQACSVSTQTTVNHFFLEHQHSLNKSDKCVILDPGRREFTIPDLITSNADFDSRVFRMSSPSYKLEQTNDSPPGQYYRVKHHKTWTEIETDIMQCFLSDSNYYLGYLL
jgi:hypothetical protein